MNECERYPCTWQWQNEYQYIHVVVTVMELPDKGRIRRLDACENSMLAGAGKEICRTHWYLPVSPSGTTVQTVAL